MKRKLPDWLQALETGDLPPIKEKHKKQCNNTAVNNSPTTSNLNGNADLVENEQNHPTSSRNIVESSLPTNGNHAEADEPVPSTSNSNNEIPTSLLRTIKREPIDIDDSPALYSLAGASNTSTSADVKIKKEIKSEPVDNAAGCSSSTNNNSSNNSTDDEKIKVKKEKPADSVALRPTCQFGIKCYRLHPNHRSTYAHPGDADYRRPDLPDPPAGTPPCPWGSSCYRRNPQHFAQLSHPPSINPQQQPRIQTVNLNAITTTLLNQIRSSRSSNPVNYRLDDDSDAEEPFFTDDEEDYVNNSAESSSDDEDYTEELNSSENLTDSQKLG